MERLTEKSPTGKNCIPLKNAAQGINIPKWVIRETSFLESRLEGDAADRLAAYEDTGLTPEEITAAADRRHNCKIECLLEKYNKVIEERDTLKKALELMRKYFKKNQIGIDIDYFVQQAQEQEGNHER